MKRYKAYRNDDTREAAALKYEAGKDNAPRVTGLGRGYLAGRMIREAQRNRVQVVQDKNLSCNLHRLSVGDEIPEALYRVVAEILAFVYRMDEKAFRETKGTGKPNGGGEADAHQ
jgi:flagellar biosynthesis protein